ncbi:hypothetical protein [uncultured Brachyspira sp.]|uniref:tetratricopeptide repeat protein n=1 Tax=uncultured Brachyspira sp. TaxID=221953 RepID=UPI0025FE67EB|nr:hypothetical protein [uncultured Brachyspira sp.]
MNEKTVKKFNLFILILFPLILLVFSITYNIYSTEVSKSIKKELEHFTNSLSLRMESKYTDMIGAFFKDELNNHDTADRFTNLVKEQVRLGITPHYNSLKFYIDYTMKAARRNTTYALVFVAVLMFILTLIVNFTNNDITVSYSSNNTHNADKISSGNKNNDNMHTANPIGYVIDSSLSDSIKAEIEEMYKSLAKEIKNSRYENALEITEKMFQLDGRNYLTLNGAGISYTKIYLKENKSEHFKKADKYFEYALSLYNHSENILNNRAVLYSLKYELKKTEEDYETALIIFNDALSRNHLDTELINNRAALYLVKYKMSTDENIFEKALNDYEEIMKNDRNNIYALNNRSMLYFHKYKNSGDKAYFDKSIEDCNRAFKINSSKALQDNGIDIYIYKF